MIVMAYFGQIQKKFIWESMILFGTVIAMFFTAIISARFNFIGALHPIIALLLFMYCIKIVTSYRSAIPKLAK